MNTWHMETMQVTLFSFTFEISGCNGNRNCTNTTLTNESFYHSKRIRSRLLKKVCKKMVMWKKCG